MRHLFVGVARFCLSVGVPLSCLPAGLVAQGAQRPDSLQAHGDSLVRRPVELEPVTVTATPVVREEPRATIHLSPLRLRALPALDPYDLLRQAAALEIHEQGQGPGFAADASLRGFSSDHSTDLALWVDGVPNNEPVNAHAEGYNDWNLLFPEAIEGIDVLKGPTSPLYGNFALAGVVNVHTLERLDHSILWLAPGSYGRLEGGLLTGYDRGPNGGVVGLRVLTESGWRPHSGYTIGQGHARTVQQLSPRATVDAGLELYGTRWDSPGFLADSNFQQRAFTLVTDTTDGGFKRRAQERLSLRLLAGNGLVWRTTAYATQGRWQLYLTIPPEPGAGEGSGSQTEEEDRRYGAGLTSALTWQRAGVEWTLGGEARWDRSAFERWFTTARARDSAQALGIARQLSGAVFLAASGDLGRHLRLTWGGRYDVQRTATAPRLGAPAHHTAGVFAPKVGALYHLPKLGDLYVNLSRGFRRTDGVVTDPTLPFITAWSYEAGVKLDGPRISADLAWFRMDLSNEQTFDPLTARSTSGGRSRRQGLEAGVVLRPWTSVRLSADWTLNDARYRQFVTADGDTLNGQRVFNTARYLGLVDLAIGSPGGPWSVSLRANVVGPYTPFDEPGVELPAYGLVHLWATRQVGSVELSAGVRNLLDRWYPELRAGGVVAPGTPRTVTVRLLYRLGG